MIPRPPSHWVNERHMRTAGATASMSVKTEAPVVVKPEADSNRASTGEGIAPESR